METPSWKQSAARHRRPVLWRSVLQLATTILPYLALWVLMVWTRGVSCWLTLALAILTGGFLVRCFIIFHDCGHGSFFRSRFANDFWGCITGVLTFTPYHQWRYEHAVHHATSGDLDRRGTGDIWTLTVEEYLRASRWKRLAYHLARNPFVLLVLAPLYLFLIQQRIPSRAAAGRGRWGVHLTSATLLAIAVAMSLAIGLKTYLLMQLAVVLVGGAAGVWLFYVQHQFEGAYWERHADWDFVAAAVKGSSFYKLPRILQWFSGNIGFHHIHHLAPGIPNYNLERCHNEEPMFRAVKPVTLAASMKSLTYRLWDERAKQLVGYRRLRALRKEPPDARISL